MFVGIGHALHIVHRYLAIRLPVRHCTFRTFLPISAIAGQGRSHKAQVKLWLAMEHPMLRTALALPLAAALAAAPAMAFAQSQASTPAPRLSLDHRMLVRCSAAFAIVATGQENGNAEALRYPAMGERGREFFVRASAQVMDEAGLDREQISAALSAEAQDLWDSGSLAEVMPVCLGLLPAE